MNKQQATSGTGTPPQGQTSSKQGNIDIEKLAEKVYQLMRTEARLTRARGQMRPKER